jgi:hypothetical protein
MGLVGKLKARPISAAAMPLHQDAGRLRLDYLGRSSSACAADCSGRRRLIGTPGSVPFAKVTVRCPQCRRRSTLRGPHC